MKTDEVVVGGATDMKLEAPINDELAAWDRDCL